jgi:NifU-like protein involved in Fe-S cluster formation
MSARRAGAVLYTPEILSLAVDLAEFPLNDSYPLRATVRSRTCGSEVALGMSATPRGEVEAVGARVTACAIGQAAAALYLRAAVGCGAKTHVAMVSSLRAWLSGDGPLPAWPGLGVLEPVLPHRGRHEAILLPWRAGLDALSKLRPAD